MKRLYHTDPNDPKNAEYVDGWQSIAVFDHHQVFANMTHLTPLSWFCNHRLMKMLETLRVSEKRGQMFRLEAHQHELLLGSGDPRVFRRPIRHKLLQLRSKKPDLFSKPLPLTQEEIRADETLRQVRCDTLLTYSCRYSFNRSSLTHFNKIFRQRLPFYFCEALA